ncbi:hypothetical protein Vretimale_6246 [Volvox reticuliferus]|uniref:Uncharacterized protein n=1 Tax=Volvox reticuliferus TaxID=1737510 RepID=A0A8J4CBN9_9CHLO|nr:hypothetical protein Vretifemale_8045 [Volvox reticuliferus]GIM01418.1 hypothetical protein Vretimale_6246 [Volvox reticuliferus]
MVANFAVAHHHLKDIAAANAAGDPGAIAAGAALFLRLLDESEVEGEDAAELLFCFLLEVASPATPLGESIRSLLGNCVLEVLPRLMQLATVSPRAATSGAALVELLAMGMPGLPSAGSYCQEVCSPRELLTALLEVYDLHKDADPDAPTHIMLLQLLGLIPRLVAAVQRRRLPVALSCLAAVADLAVAEGQNLAVVRGMAEAAGARAHQAAAVAGNGGRGRFRGEGHQAEVEAVMDIWREEEMRLVAPFVSFAQQLQELVLATEFSALPLTSQRTAADTNTAAARGAASSPEHLRRLTAWLLALFGALWPAWGPIQSAGGGGAEGAATAGSWCGTPAAATLLNLLLGIYLPSRSRIGQQQQQQQQQPRSGENEENGRAAGGVPAMGKGRCGGGGCGAVDWSYLWAAAGAAADPDMEVASDLELPLLGAATILWLATAASTPTATVAITAAAASATAASTYGWNCPAAPEPPEGDPHGALKVLMEACKVLLRYASAGESAVQLNRALQLLAAGSAQVRRMAAAGAAKVSVAAPPAAVPPPAAALFTDAAPTAPGYTGESGEDPSGEPTGISASPLPPPPPPPLGNRTSDPWVGVANQLGSRSGFVSANELIDILDEYTPRLGEREEVLQPLANSLASDVAINVAHGPPGPRADATQTLAHTALQSLLDALSPPMRALCLEYLAAGPSPAISALALQRLQREIARTLAVGGVSTSVADGTRGSASGGAPVNCAAFAGPWVLLLVLEQLLPLLQQVEAEPSEAAVATLTHHADAATAAVSVLRFLTLRQRAEAAAAGTTASTGARGTGICMLQQEPSREAAGEGGGCTSPILADNCAASPQLGVVLSARGVVLTAVYDAVVRPFSGTIPAALSVLRRQVELEEGPFDMALPPTPMPTPPPQQRQPLPPSSSSLAAGAFESVTALRQPPQSTQQRQGEEGVHTADRFAGNVAVVSEPVAGLTALSRLQEVVDYVAELLDHNGV